MDPMEPLEQHDKQTRSMERFSICAPQSSSNTSISSTNFPVWSNLLQNSLRVSSLLPPISGVKFSRSDHVNSSANHIPLNTLEEHANWLLASGPRRDGSMEAMDDQPLDLTTKFAHQQNLHSESSCLTESHEQSDATKWPPFYIESVRQQVSATWRANRIFRHTLNSLFYHNYRNTLHALFRNSVTGPHAPDITTTTTNDTGNDNNNNMNEGFNNNNKNGEKYKNNNKNKNTSKDRIENVHNEIMPMTQDKPACSQLTPQHPWYLNKWPKTCRDSFWTKEADRMIQQPNTAFKIGPTINHEAGRTIESSDSTGTLTSDSSTSSKPVRRAYTESELSAAVRAICFGRLGTRRAASVYGIPRSTLRNKICKLNELKKREEERQGGKTIMMSDFLQFLMHQMQEKGTGRNMSQSTLQRVPLRRWDVDGRRRIGPMSALSMDSTTAVREQAIVERRAGRFSLSASRIASIFQVNCRKTYISRKQPSDVQNGMRPLETTMSTIRRSFDRTGQEMLNPEATSKALNTHKEQESDETDSETHPTEFNSHENNLTRQFNAINSLQFRENSTDTESCNRLLQPVLQSTQSAFHSVHHHLR